MPVEQSVVWMWDISRGTMGIIPGLYVTVADNAANKYQIPNHLAINPKYHDPKKIYEEYKQMF